MTAPVALLVPLTDEEAFALVAAVSFADVRRAEFLENTNVDWKSVERAEEKLFRYLDIRRRVKT